MEVKMKNLAVKISSVFVLAIILTVVSVQAQSYRQFEAHIPFDFIIGKKAYKAGDYNIGVRSLNQNATILSLKNAETRNLREMAVVTNGSRSQMDKAVLMFDRHGSQYVLTQMVSPEFGLTVPKTKAKKLAAKKFGKPDESLAVVLINRDREIE